MAQRDAMPDKDSRFFDVQFSDIITDPIAIIDNLYKHFGFDFSTEARQAMQHYLDHRPRDKHGTHQYTLEDFGLMSKGTQSPVPRVQSALWILRLLCRDTPSITGATWAQGMYEFLPVRKCCFSDFP